MANLTTLADYIGASLSLTTTVFFAKNNYRAWFLCLIANFVNLYLYAASGVYAHVVLKIICIFIASYGLWHWLYGGANKTELKVSNLPTNEGLILLFFVIACYSIARYLLLHFTHSTIVELDALAMSLSLAGQWLSARKYLQSWAVWFINDSMMLALFYYKNLPAHMILNLLYLFIAVYGYTQWSKSLKAVKASQYEYH